MKLTRDIQVRYLPHKYINIKKQEMFFLDAIASPSTHPGQWVSGSVMFSDFGDSLGWRQVAEVSRSLTSQVRVNHPWSSQPCPPSIYRACELLQISNQIHNTIVTIVHNTSTEPSPVQIGSRLSHRYGQTGSLNLPFRCLFDPISTFSQRWQGSGTEVKLQKKYVLKIQFL